MIDKVAERIVEVYTSDRYIFQKIRLAAPDEVTVTRGVSNTENPIRLVDIDTAQLMPKGAFISMSRTDDTADIKIPFSIDTLAMLISKAKPAPPLTISKEERCAYLRGEKIRLTELEYSLLSLLYGAGGEYVSREDILANVWDKGADPGVLNVYVHYLREKLEGSGEKIILSSRKCGYKVSEKYIEGVLP